MRVHFKVKTLYKQGDDDAKDHKWGGGGWG